MYLLILLLSIKTVQSQQDLCSCSCCTGQFCTPLIVGSLYIPSCTIDTCGLQCRSVYAQCQIYPPNGQIVAQCSISVKPLYNCQCYCCNLGSTSCTPIFVGTSTSYVCQSDSCSISCSTQYPSQCVGNHNGQVIGSCTSNITTTSTTTSGASLIVPTNVPGSGQICSCMCCQSGPNCSPNIDMGITPTSSCSASTCVQACQNRYPVQCPSLAYLGQTNGVCISQTSGNTRCECQCCTTNGCLTYAINTNGNCIICSTLCRQQSICGTTNTITYSCSINKEAISADASFITVMFLSIVVLL